MTRRILAALFLLAILPLALAICVHATSRAWLPRHPGLVDRPWADDPTCAVGKDEPRNLVTSDPVNLLYPDMVFNGAEAKAGRFPLWNPTILGGVTHAANPVPAVFYPVNWPLWFMEPLNALVASAAIHVFLAGAFYFLFLRRIGLGVAASLFGGLAFAFSGWVAAHVRNTPLVATAAWIPLGLYAIESRLRARTRLPLALLAIAIAMMFLAGFPQDALYGGLALGLYVMFGVARRIGTDGARPILAEASLFLGSAVFGFLLAAPLLLPLSQLMPETGHRSSSVEALVDERFRPGALAGLVLPTAFGGADGRVAEENLLLRFATGDAPEFLVPKIMNWSERTLYPGMLVLLLALAGLLEIRKRPAFALAAILGGGIALATVPAAIAVVAHVRGFDVGAPARAVLLVALALPGLAALGFERVFAGVPRRFVLRAFLGFGILVLLIPLCAVVAYPIFIESFIRLLQYAGLERHFGLTAPKSFVAYVPVLSGPACDVAFDLVRVGSAFVILAVLGILHARQRGAAAKAVACVFLLVDLGSFFIPYNLPVTRRCLFTTPPEIARLREESAKTRFARVGASRFAVLADVPNLFVPNLGTVFGLLDAQGYREQIPSNLIRAWNDVAGATNPTGVGAVLAERTDALLLRLLRVRHLVASAPIPSLENRRIRVDGGVEGRGLVLYENPGDFPRAFIVHQARWTTAETIATALASDAAAVPDEILFEGRSDALSFPLPAGEPERFIVLEETPSALALEVETRADGWLVVTDAFATGWSARVIPLDDDAHAPVDTPVLPAYGIARAVRVPQGHHRVELTYEPPGLRSGVALAALAILGIGLFLVLRHRPPPRPDSLTQARKGTP